jgi:anti-sigma B factor antagonist
MITSACVAKQVIVLEPNGRLTAETVHVFDQVVARRLREGCYGLILDLQNVDYLDSAGIGALAQTYTLGRQQGARVVFVHVFGKNRELLRITKLLTVFEVYDTTTEAQRSFPAPAGWASA